MSPLLPNHFQSRFDHFFCGQLVMLVQLFRHISRLAEFTMDTERPNAMADAGVGKGMRYLGSHSPHQFVIFNGNNPAMAVFGCRADRLEVDPIDKWIVDHAGGYALL